jgi:hypothetical protein
LSTFEIADEQKSIVEEVFDFLYMITLTKS